MSETVQCFLGIDSSTKTGFVMLQEDGKVLYAAESAPNSSGLQRASDLAEDLCGLIELYGPMLAVTEGYGYANHHTLATLVEIGTVLRYFMRQYDQPYVVVTPASLKKFVTGKGNCSKSMILKEVYKRWGFEAATDNVADAYGLAQIGLNLYKPDADLIKPQKEVISLLKATQANAISCIGPRSLAA